MSETQYGQKLLFDCFFLYICHTVIQCTQKVAKCCVHEKKLMLKKKEGWAIRGTIGSCPQVPVILKSVSLSDPMLCATFTYSIMSTAVLVVTSKPNFYFQANLVNNYMYISIKFCICLLIQDQGYLISDQLRELSRQCLFHIKETFENIKGVINQKPYTEEGQTRQ